MTKKERKDIKHVLDLLIRCDRVIHQLANNEKPEDFANLVIDLKNNGITSLRRQIDKTENCLINGENNQ